MILSIFDNLPSYIGGDVASRAIYRVYDKKCMPDLVYMNIQIYQNDWLKKNLPYSFGVDDAMHLNFPDEELLPWIIDNLRGAWHARKSPYGYIRFEDKSDAALFKLRWF